MQLNNNQWGLAAIGGGTFAIVAVYDSVVAQNTDVGLYADRQGLVRIFHSLVADNGDGVQALLNGRILLAESMVAGTNVLFDQETGGRVSSFGDNYFYSGSSIGQLDTYPKY